MTSPRPDRIHSIDVLRGFALLGILLVNCAYFALPQNIAGEMPSLETGSTSELLAWAFVRAFFELKFVALFSFLFGIGFAMQAKGSTPGDGFKQRYGRRLLLLAIFGALHGVFLFMGDVLLCYSACGVVLLLTQSFSSRTKLLLGAGLVLAMIPWMGVLQGLETLEEPVPETQSSLELSTAGPLDFLSAYVEQTPAAFAIIEQQVFAEGPSASSIAMRAAQFFVFLVFCLVYFGWRALGFFFLGAAAFEYGLFEPQGLPWLRRMRSIGLGAGIPLTLGATAFSIWSAGHPGPLVAALDGCLAELAGLLIPMGFAGAVLLWANDSRNRLLSSLSAVGRTALTNYIGQSVLMGFLFYHWGLGLYGQASLTQLLLISVGVLGLQLVLSPLWLARFRMGPLEWLWRWATYGQRPAFRRT